MRVSPRKRPPTPPRPRRPQPLPLPAATGLSSEDISGGGASVKGGGASVKGGGASVLGGSGCGGRHQEGSLVRGWGGDVGYVVWRSEEEEGRRRGDKVGPSVFKKKKAWALPPESRAPTPRTDSKM
ncbi:unnamed protein product [Linum trigynum]|uniref:Uncharacterized protein n=1 Tax=Linum trigynum TaxID=586398 RepID=A0AAV2EN74_9ROSI